MKKAAISIGVFAAIVLIVFGAMTTGNPTNAQMEAELKKRDEVLLVHTKLLISMEEYFAALQRRHILPKPARVVRK